MLFLSNPKNEHKPVHIFENTEWDSFFIFRGSSILVFNFNCYLLSIYCGIYI